MLYIGYNGGFVQGEFVLGGILSRGILFGGFCSRTHLSHPNKLYIVGNVIYREVRINLNIGKYFDFAIL